MRTSFRMEDKNISMIRGDTLSFGFALLDENEEPFIQDLDTCFFTCKSNRSETETVFQKSLKNGISKVGDGKYRVRIAPQDTENIEPKKYFYDLQLGINGDIFTVLHGVLEIEQDVTFGTVGNPWIKVEDGNEIEY